MYDLGKWHPELGDYETWKKAKLEDFDKYYERTGLDECGLTTGGVLLLAEGLRRKEPLHVA